MNEKVCEFKEKRKLLENVGWILIIDLGHFLCDMQNERNCHPNKYLILPTPG